MRPAKRSLSVINDGVKFSVFFESQIPRRILCAASGSNVNQFRKRSVILYFLQCKPLAPLFLRQLRSLQGWTPWEAMSRNVYFFFCKWPMPIMQASEMLWVEKIFPHRISPLSLQRIFLKYFQDKPRNKRPCNVEFCRNQGEFVERLPFLFRHIRAKIDTWKQAAAKRCTANT